MTNTMSIANVNRDQTCLSSIQARASALIAEMTVEEKMGQLIHPFHVPGDIADANVAAIAAGTVGGIAYVMDPYSTNSLQRIAMEQSRLKIPLLIAIDVLHGFRTIFPVPIGTAASWDLALIEQITSIGAREARSVGITLTYSPMLDIGRDPRWGRMVEGAGEDPFLGSAIAVAQVRGLQGPAIGSPGHVIACPKHFCGYGSSIGGRDYGEVDLSESDLRNIHFPPFEAAVRAGAGSIMNAYMALNGVPAAANHWLLTDVLRTEWGFEGFVMSDANTVKSLVTQDFARDEQDAATRALKAGLDAELPLGPSTLLQIPKALAAGDLDTATLDEAVRRILMMKIRLGLFESPYVDEDEAETILNDPAHREIARKAAERSAVLLKNEGSLLPLDASSLASVAVIGFLADSRRDTIGNWIFVANPDETITVLDGIRAKLGDCVKVEFAPGVLLPERKFPSPFAILDGPPPDYSSFDVKAELEKAVSLAAKSDVVVMVLGEGQNMSGESSGRSTLALPGEQEELLRAVAAAGKPIVLLIMGARPLELRWASTNIPAIMDIWYPGTKGGEAVANLLFGDAVPAGKLPYSWPRDVGQVPMFYAQRRSHQPETDDKRYWNEESTPLYPFGFGLSYTTFVYSNLIVDRPHIALGGTINISVDVGNTGTRPADEVAQLYIHQRYGSAMRPTRELKGFQRVAIQAGETRTLHFTLGPSELRYWSSATRGWVQEATTFDLWVGGNSTAPLTTVFDVIVS